MAESTVESRMNMEKNACGHAEWIIKDWAATHEVFVAAEASCHVEIANPKVVLRFFLRPKENLVQIVNGDSVLNKFYSLWAEVVTPVNQNGAIKVNAIVTDQRSGKTLLTKNGTVTLKKTERKVLEVIDQFLHIESFHLDQYDQFDAPSHYGFTKGLSEIDIKITINGELFRLIENSKTVAPVETLESSLAEAEESLIQDLKNMFVEHENYADLKLESMDNMTLDAHKFILMARSRYLRKCIEDAMKLENFNGKIKIKINGKPLVVILHWIYTGELHENSGNVMEEVVDAAILFELTQLMKILDKKLVTICNKENMFRLYQVAQKNGMPHAMDEISVYIRENL